MLLKLAIDEYLLYVQIERNYSSHTIDSYEYDLHQFLTFLQDHHCSTTLSDITKTQVRRFIHHQLKNQKQKPSSVNRKISCLKSFTTYCLQENYLTNNFMNGVQKAKSDSTLPVYMTLHDLKQLFRSLETDTTNLGVRNEIMFKLLAATGMRRSELVTLKWQDVDLTNQTVRIIGKGKKERLLPLHQGLIDPLLAYKGILQTYQTYPTEPIFRNKNGKILDPRGLHFIFKKVLKEAGLPPSRFSLHHLRHTFATLMLQENNENVELRTLQELLGHESISSTEVYTHIEFKQKKKAIDSFNIF